MHLRKSTIIVITTILLPYVNCEQHTRSAGGRRQGKQLNWFSVVRFKNGECETNSGGKKGTCYTESECEDKGGVNSGSCAEGFGVCCTFNLGCGETFSENCTYFEGTGATTSGSCVGTICPCSGNICQLRLDFDQFVISGPSTQGGVVVSNLDIENGLISFSSATACLTDTFAVSNTDGPAPPTICGTNTGEHMYVDANEGCNRLSFLFGPSGFGTSIANRAWSIKVTQYSCEFSNLAPSGCTQYFFGSTSGTLDSYNYQDGRGVQLGGQTQNICVRREAGQCRICYTTASPTDFDLSGSVTIGTNGGVCCNYAPSNADDFGFDCVNIPLASTVVNGVNTNSNFCGRNAGINGGTFCSTRQPFSLIFRSDAFDVPMENNQGINRGFSIVYTMDAINCP